MATYEYECPANGERFEIIASMKKPPPEWIVLAVRANPATGLTVGEWAAAFASDIENAETQPTDLFDMWTVRRVYAGARVMVGTKMPRHIIPAEKGALPLSYAASRRKTGTLVNRDGHVVRENADGTHNTPDGIPICDTAENTQKHMDAGGTQWD